MQETRRKVIELLRLRGSQTVDDLTRALRLTRTAVISHLAALQGDGFVVRRGLRPAKRRPRVLYALTAAADELFPKAYEDFASSLLEEVKRRDGQGLKGLLKRIGDGWVARDLPRVEGSWGCERLERAKEILAERGFMPVLDREGKGYLLREHNCPLLQLAVDHPEICDMVHGWLTGLFGVPLQRVSCIRQGDSNSAYRITSLPQRRKRISDGIHRTAIPSGPPMSHGV